MNNLSDRILNGEKIYLSNRVTNFTTGTLHIFWIISLIITVFLVVLAFIQLSTKGEDESLLIMLCAIAPSSFLINFIRKSLAEVWIEGQKLHIRKIQGTYDIIPFANINKVKSYQQKGGKSLVIHYTNMQGLDDKVSFGTATFSKDDAEDVLLLAQTLGNGAKINHSNLF
jgi:hypothetical protein